MATHGESFRLDQRYVRPDGTIVWANSAVTRLLDEAGNPRAALAVTTDITERKMEERRRAFILRLTDLTRPLADPEAVIAATTRALGEELGATRVVYAEIDDARNLATVQGDWTDGTAAHLPATVSLNDFGKALIDRLRSGGTLRIDDTTVDPHTKDDLEALNAIMARAVVSVPLFKDETFVVNLNVHQNAPRAWTSAEVELIEAVAERTWEAVERARIESALRESEERHRQIVEGAEDFAIISLDEKGVIRSWNTGAERLTGFSEMDAIGQSGEMIFSPGDRETGLPEQEMDQAKRDGRAVNERWHQGKDGTQFWGSGLLMRRDTQSGGYLKIFRDRTAEHEAEARLRELNETLEQRVLEVAAERERAWHVSQELLAVVEQDGRFAEINAAWTPLLGWKPAELLGQPFSKFTHPDDLEATQAKFAATLETQLVKPFEFRFLRKGGGYRWFAWTATFEHGRVYASGRDVNAVKEQQAELDAAQEALRQSQKMEAMGQLTGGVAHDFNNLLTPIVGSLDMLQRRGLGDEREQRLIAGAMQSAERATMLVQRLLAFARRQPLQAVPVDLASLVKGMGDLVSSTTGPQIKVVVDAPDDLPPAKADPNQLEMALLNLAVNARDAMPGGGTLRISVSTAMADTPRPSGLKPGDFIRLSVADTGTGMDETTLARAVEPFFSTKGVGKGTGLGLSMAHGLASQLGGALTIQSQPQLGTNIELWLPVSTTKPSPAEQMRGAGDAAAPRGTALLVDDEELVRMSTADMLIDLGYSVLEAACGEEAIRILNEGKRIDLLVTDHLMPGMTGTDLAHAVRMARPGLPVLLVSGYAERDGIEPDLPRLAKPFRKHELDASLAQFTPK